MTADSEQPEIPPARQPGLGWLADTPPSDDTGARTQSAFRFQHECTARLCAPLLVSERVMAVVCEEHEDCIVFFENVPPQLVSIKHRDGSRGPWTFNALLAEGGIGHLYERWLGTGKQADCLLMTNASLRSGDGEAREFANACHSRDASVCAPWAKRLAPKFQVEEQEAGTFMSILSIEADLPGRESIGAVNVRDLVMPAMERLGLATEAAQIVYDGLVNV